MRVSADLARGPRPAAPAWGKIAHRHRHPAAMFRTTYIDHTQLTAQLAAWAQQHPGIAHVSSLGQSALGRDIPPGTWLTVYGGLTAAIVVVALARAAIFFEAAVRAATAVHADAAAAVMRAPLSFFHTTPAGRILNRFTKDQVRAKGGERGAGGLARGRPVPRPRRRNPSPPSPPLSSSGHHG
jgi:hypothetical protein